MSDSLARSSSAQCGLLGRSALHICFMSHTFPIWWASKAFCFNCKACSDSLQLICMFVCLPARAIGNLFSLLQGWKRSAFIELAAGLVHFHAGLDVEAYEGWFSLIAAKEDIDPLLYFCWDLRSNKRRWRIQGNTEITKFCNMYDILHIQLSG